MKLTDRVKHAWSAFNNNILDSNLGLGPSYSRPIHRTTSVTNTAGYVSSIYNRIALDVAMTGFKHAKINPENEDMEPVNSGLHNCLTVEANIDQTHIQFMHDLVYSMFDEGVVAVVPVETTINPKDSGSYEINSLRVGRVISWFPKHVEVEVYNEDTGDKERIFIEKRLCGIIENPLYSVINQENSTLKRLIRKLNQLDDMDALASNRLDVLISVPYSIKTENQRMMAEKRISDIEAQLASGRNGIAYIDGTEKAMQLNRPVNDQLPENIEKLQQSLYNQLGLTENIFNGTANPAELRIYNSRTIDPIAEAIVSEFTRKFLTKTARTQGHKITYFRDLFKTVPVEVIAGLGDSFRRNYIATPNEIRKIVGFKPSNDPRADELFNPNMPDDKQQGSSPVEDDQERKSVVPRQAKVNNDDDYNFRPPEPDDDDD